MRAWIQRVDRTNKILADLKQLAYAFRTRGEDVQWFDVDDIATGQLDDELLVEPAQGVVCGGVGAVTAALDRAGRPVPMLDDLPNSLACWIDRSIWRMTLGEFRQLVSNEPDRLPLHLKPDGLSKLFDGDLIRRFDDLLPTANVPAETAVLAQGYVEFVSEWRSTILNGSVLNVAHYKGDPVLFPDSHAIKNAPLLFESAPIAYALDWGVTSTGSTELVEFNDAFSLGNYGLSPNQYATLLTARWHEMMGLRSWR